MKRQITKNNMELDGMLEVFKKNSEYYQRKNVILWFSKVKLNLLEEIAQDTLWMVKMNQNDKTLANNYFDLLDKLLLILEKLSFVYNVNLSKYLNRLLRNIYRLDQECSRDYYLENIDKVIEELNR